MADISADSFDFHSNSSLQKLFQLWSTIPGVYWTKDTNILPTHLTDIERNIATKELKAIPEYFYSCTKLPIITPDNVQAFIHTIYGKIDSFAMFSICSGSGRLLLTLTGVPFFRCVLFPVDLRYGWDMNHKPHQQLIMLIDRTFKPAVTTIEPRCKHWSRSGNTRAPELTYELRQNELYMLRFFTTHMTHITNDDRDGLVENPQGSDIWRDSPLQALEAITKFQEHSRDTAQCPFSAAPDGERHLKRTRLKSTFPLRKSIAQCRCNKPHIVLQGYDKDRHQQRTAAAALFSRKFCFAICTDIESHLKTKQTKMQRRNTKNREPTKQHHQSTTPTYQTDNIQQATFTSSSSSQAPATETSVAETPEQRLLRLSDELRKIDTSALNLTDTIGITNGLDRQLVLAALQEILDDAHKLHKQGHLNVIHQSSSQQITLEALEHLTNQLATFITPVLITAHGFIDNPTASNQLYTDQQLPTQHLAQLAIHCDSTANFNIQLHKDYQLDNIWTLPDDTIFLLLFYGRLTPQGERLGQLRRVVGKTRQARPDIDPPPGLDLPSPDDQADEQIKINSRNLKAFKPSTDLRNLPRQLVSASPDERTRLLRGLHERFWHCPPQDMMRLLQAALLPRDIVLQGIEICHQCPHCKKFAPKIHKATVKSFMASSFNEVVQHDLFFLFDETFMLLIDECIKWKTGDQLPNKQTTALLKALLYLWLRMFGPMANLLSDQEGGLLSDQATSFFDRFGITRLLVGQGATGTKGLVERHIALTKHSMLCLKQAATQEGLIVTNSDICMESCMAQNLMLEYHGGTPQAALTGSYQRPLYNLDSDTITSTTGSLESRPDFVESALRLRLLAKQAIAQSIIQDRLARAAQMKQYKHPTELLQPGMMVDIWKQPNRKDEYGWRGPAELISLERRAGSCIVRHQGMPLIVPLAHIRKHILNNFWNHAHRATEQDNDYVNPNIVRYTCEIFVEQDFLDTASDEQHRQLSTIMDIVDGQPPGKSTWIGLQWVINDFKYIPDEQTVKQNLLMVIGKKLLQPHFTSIHGVIFGNGLRRIPSIPRATWGLMIHYRRLNRMQYHFKLIKVNIPHKFNNDFDQMSTILYYSYDHQEEDKPTDPIDWSDISSIMKPDDTLPDTDVQMPQDLDYSDNGTSPDNSMKPRTDSTDTDMPDQPSQPPDPPQDPKQPPRPPRPRQSTTPPIPWITRQSQEPPSLPPRDEPPDTPSPQTPGTPMATSSTGNSDNAIPNAPLPNTEITPREPRKPSPMGRRDDALRTPDTPADPVPKRLKRTDTDSSNDSPSKQTSPSKPPTLPNNERSRSRSPPTRQTETEIRQQPSAGSADDSKTDDQDKTAGNDDEHKTHHTTHTANSEPLKQLTRQLHITNNDTRQIHEYLTDIDDQYSALTTMTRDLSHELSYLLKETQLQSNDHYLDLITNEVFRVDDETAIIAEKDFGKYRDLILAADHKELSQFMEHKVFLPRLRTSIDFADPDNGNLVDCVWIRKWKIYGIEVKSRMCARGCFDRQKFYIERHSSTATRLSQRILLSSSMLNDYLYDDGTGIDVESLDISCAFLQGLDYKTLERLAKSLGYESRKARKVFVVPPENVWSHFRNMASAPSSFRVPDKDRALWILECLRAMYGFADAPLMFQLALMAYLKSECEALQSVLDENYLFWIGYINGSWRTLLVLTAHVDDLQIAGNKRMRNWLHRRLEQRFGKLKRECLPYTHAGIQLERLPSGTLLAHQEHFCSKLSPITIPQDRLQTPESDLQSDEIKTFRSLTCSGLWAAQTRLDEMCQITSLQTALKSPKVKDLIAVNATIKRLRKTGKERVGIYFRRLHPPFRVVTVSDASSANKASNFATEGTAVLIMEDRITKIQGDKDDFITPELVKLVGGKAHLLVGSSQKSKRISHSTSHAETHSAAKIIPVGQIVSLRLGEPSLHGSLEGMITARILAEIVDTGKLPVPCDHFIDCMDLWELACGIRGVPQDKSQRLGILSIREERRTERLRRFFHVRTHWMLVDMLTKHSGYVSKSLLELLTCGIWNVDSTIRCREHFGATEKA